MILSPSNYELEVFAFSEGSFTLHMQTVAPSDLVGYSYISRAMDILDSVNYEIEDTQKALDIVSQYGGHFATAYKELLAFVVENEMPFSYEWTMPSMRDATSARIIPRHAKPLYEALQEKKDIGIEERSFIGRFTKLDEKTGAWRLVSDDDGKEYNGTSEVKLAGLTIETQKYRLRCEEKLEEDRCVTGREYTRLIIKDVRSHKKAGRIRPAFL